MYYFAHFRAELRRPSALLGARERGQVHGDGGAVRLTRARGAPARHRGLGRGAAPQRRAARREAAGGRLERPRLQLPSPLH